MDEKSNADFRDVTAGENDAKGKSASSRSRRGLDWFVFFVADVQTGFGPFVAVYLTAQKWTQTDIGLILTVGGLIALFGQIPGGAILDAMRSPRLAAALSVVLIGVSALILALWPVFPAVLGSRILQAGASCILGPAIAALSLGLVRRTEIGERLGRNGSFASIGTGLAAAGMGACGYYISNQAVFFVTAAFVVPALIALLQINTRDIDPNRAHGSSKTQPLTLAAVKSLLTNRTLAIFALCVLLFHLANAAMLPLVASMLTLQSSQSSAALIAVAMVVPQFVVAILSPTVGRKSQQWGRRPILLIGFSALVIRAVLFAAVTPSELIVLVQVLDGISAAALGVLVPLSIADITRDSGRFNLTQGLVGCAMGIGASISTTLAGILSDRFSSSFTFLALGVVAAIGLAAVWKLMPETRPELD
ncbi:ABC transporter permease [Afipia sp. Root123D2]|uniref:MFS transporter n=1 Tax=Afipia sp. Root123D2 TaxID=1736436 RepID=UPI0006F6C90D|nr:MFS transporter [Afipia sp. Root123D2]KQW20873.1 ABC transporter permease [Afipia sp. Root123D2]